MYVFCYALSLSFPKVEALNVGQHQVVCQVMKGISQKKPLLLRYSVTWVVSRVPFFYQVFRTVTLS